MFRILPRLLLVHCVIIYVSTNPQSTTYNSGNILVSPLRPYVTDPKAGFSYANQPSAQPTVLPYDKSLPFPPGISYSHPELAVNRNPDHQPRMPLSGTADVVYTDNSTPAQLGSSDGTAKPVTQANGETESSFSTRDQIVRMIMAKYRSYERPPSRNATVVTVNMRILAIFSIDVRTMDYYVDALLRQTWNDPRLSWKNVPRFAHYNETLVSPKLKEQLWLPDLFFRNGKDGYLHKLTLPNYLLRVYPDGNVLYSQKITMRFSCQMQLRTFPMDTQSCNINIGSYGYTLNELKFVWDESKAVELPKNLQLSEFESPKSFHAFDCSDNYSTSTGQYTCLEAKFELQRQLGSYLATTYVPNILIIMVSWLSFWVNVDSAPARVPLGLLSLLGILTQALSASSTLPRVSYIKAIDVWMIFSIIFVIGVLVEYAVALTVLRRKQTQSWHEDVKTIVHEELTGWCAICQQQQLAQLQNPQAISRGQMEFCQEMESLLSNQFISQCKDTTKPRRPPGLTDSEIDNYSRFLFPACYILYNCFYWIYYLVLTD